VEGVTDSNGEFVFSALPADRTALKVELTGFKTLQNRGMQLGAGQTVRADFAHWKSGTLSEDGDRCGLKRRLVETAASLQTDTLGAQEVYRTSDQPPQPVGPDEPDEQASTPTAKAEGSSR
jgi:hypothetical protein